jgi:hypothetical protein
LRVELLLEVAFKLAQCRGSLFEMYEVSVYRRVAARLGRVVRFGDGR